MYIDKRQAVGDVLALALPVMGLFSLELTGELYLHELALLILFPVLLIGRRQALAHGVAKTILPFGFVWLCSLVITDLIVGSPPEDFLRGWAKILVFLIATGSLIMLLTTARRALLWISASVILTFLRPFQLFADDLDPAILWKYGVGAALLTLACLPSLWRLLRNANDIAAMRRIGLLHVGFGVASFFVNARSFGGLSIVTGALLLTYIRYRGARISAAQVAAGTVIAALVSGTVIGMYALGASSGLFGTDAEEKYQAQVAYGGGIAAVMLGGRPEILVSTEAIADSPWLGHGSWAKDYRYVALLLEMQTAVAEQSHDLLVTDPNEGLIPTHSHIFGAWVEAGILGGLFWLAVLYLVLFRVLPAAIAHPSALSVYTLICIPSFVWNVFYSPFGATVRVDVAALLAIFGLVLKSARPANER